ncbi:MAG TPA: YfiR family protein [Rhodanobacteraceae bacterium]|nr:YfiR family protein [Rhodanobacteraceae bacterium]
MRTGSRWRMCLTNALAALALCVAGATCAQPSPPASLEYAIKATYLYKLAPFVEWPPPAFASKRAPFVICIVGDNPFDGYLTRAVAGRRFGTHPFAVRRLRTLEGGHGCRIVFISGLHDAHLRRTLAAVAGRPVLTVTDSTIDPDMPSVIHFVIEKGHVRFDIDLGAAARNDLKLSSKLLHLAVTVRH